MGISEEEGATIGDLTRNTVVQVLKNLRKRGYEIGGMGEYGRGWNDCHTQQEISIREEMERWENEEK